MLCANLVCMWLMFNTLKVAQAEKQIYPERFGKLSNFHTSPGAGTGEVAGARAPGGAGITRNTGGRMTTGAETPRQGVVFPPRNPPREHATTRFPNATRPTPAAPALSRILT